MNSLFTLLLCFVGIAVISVPVSLGLRALSRLGPTPSCSRKMIHPYAEKVDAGVVYITGDVDKLQRGMHYQVSTGTWIRLDKGGWKFRANLNDWQTDDLVEMINESDGI